MKKFSIGDYVRYHDGIYIIEDVMKYTHSMIFIRDVETDKLTVVYWWEFDDIDIF